MKRLAGSRTPVGKTSNVGNRKLSAPVKDVFFSFQGEGARLGEPQIFVRFAGCNLKCRYCDTKPARRENRRDYIGVEKLVARVAALAAASFPRPRVVSLTGGEPLLRPAFSAELIEALKARGFKVSLETNASRPADFAKLSRLADYVSADIKPPSAAGMNLFAVYTRAFSAAGGKLSVKLVLDDRTTLGEVERAAAIVRRASSYAPLILQPATPTFESGTVAPADLSEFRLAAEKILGAGRVKIIPQFHKVLWKVK